MVTVQNAVMRMTIDTSMMTKVKVVVTAIAMTVKTWKLVNMMTVCLGW